MKRPALTLLELAVSLVSSAMLVAGLASAVYVSSQALPSNDTVSRQSMEASKVLCDLTADVSLAISFQERTARAITFTVPDRNEDNSVETIRYAWSGTPGDPLTYQYNGGAVVNVATDVQSFNLEALTRLLLAEVDAPVEVPGHVVFEAPVKSTKAATTVTTISIAKPDNIQAGNLLIAAVALDGNAVSSLAAPGGWNPSHIGPQTVSPINQTFGVWWKIATNSEPANYAFTWSGGRQAYGWIMRFSGNDETNPIHVVATAESALPSIAPISPGLTTSVQNAMILRLGGFDGRSTSATTGILVGNVITVDKSSNTAIGSCSGAAGWSEQLLPGIVLPSTFSLTTLEEYTSVTIAIAPAMVEQ